MSSSVAGREIRNPILDRSELAKLRRSSRGPFANHPINSMKFPFEVPFDEVAAAPDKVGVIAGATILVILTNQVAAQGVVANEGDQATC